MPSDHNFKMYETDVEEATIAWFEKLDYTYIHGSKLNPEENGAGERSSITDVLLLGRLRVAIERLNPELPSDAVDEVLRRVRNLNSPNVLEDNLTFHRMLTERVSVQARIGTEIRGIPVKLVDFEDPNNNEWLVVNQLTIVGSHTRRPDVLVYLNGFPVAVVELKDPTAPKATVKRAWNQLQTYKKQIPQLFRTNGVLVVSDGIDARVGSLTSGFERFLPWRTVDGNGLAPSNVPQLQVAIYGLFEKNRFLDYLQNFILFETDNGIIKKSAAYHQFHAVNKAVASTVTAASATGDGRVGVVWHTQGSGKSISMAFYAGKIRRHPAMENPTLVVVTDRTDLDNQLFAQFARAKTLIGTPPAQAKDRLDLRTRLQVASGGVVFTTMQKFTTQDNELDYPTLSERKNIVVIADEAHRSQYGFKRGLADNLQRALPNAARIGFTGTPIEFQDRSTPEVFGNYIDIYSISRAVEDHATVPIYYEARLARLELPDAQKARVDDDFEDVVEDEDAVTQQKLRSRWARLEALVGTKKRLRLVARDIVDHFRKRLEILDGKAMIVCMSRQVAVDMYRQIIRLRPDWHSHEEDEGAIKVIISGGAEEEAHFQPHLRNKKAMEAIAKRFKNPDDELKVVIVCDMWLTGFDAPAAHTMYMDKPLRGHTLMQAIARVNRVHKDKPSGLIVDYLGVAQEMKKAVQWYDRGQTHSERPGIPVEEALTELEKRHDVAVSMFHGFDYNGFFTLDAAARVEALAGGGDHICTLDDGKKRFAKAMAALNQISGIALHLEGARKYRNDIAFFQAVQKSVSKTTTPKGESDGSLNAAIRQIVSSAIVPDDEVLDLLGMAGIEKPDISILSDVFLESVRTSPYKNLQLEVLQKLLKDQIGGMRKRNVVQARKFSEMLEEAIRKYQNKSVDAVAVVLELIEMAKKMRAQAERGEKLGLTDDEVAFYDALAEHNAGDGAMKNDDLAIIAHNLVEMIRKSVTIDWTQRDSVRARLRIRVKRLLKRAGYPPDRSQLAIQTVLKQAESSCADWAIEPPAAPIVEQPEPEVTEAPESTPAPAAEPPQMTEDWEDAFKESHPSAKAALQAVFAAGMSVPELGFEWVGRTGRMEGSQLELAWPEAHVAAILPEFVDDAVRSHLEHQGWRVFDLPGNPESVVDALR